MKMRLVSMLGICTAFAAVCLAEKAKPADPASWLSERNVERVGEVTIQDIRAFKTEWTDSKGAVTRLEADFCVGLRKPGDAKKYKTSGKIPFRVTVELEESMKRFGSNRKKRIEGKAFLYVLDSEGKIVAEESTSLAKLCSS